MSAQVSQAVSQGLISGQVSQELRHGCTDPVLYYCVLYLNGTATVLLHDDGILQVGVWVA
jgi:hypothetical protein